MRPRRVLVVGAAGMLGHALFSLLSVQEDLEVHATARIVKGLDRWFPLDLLGKIRGPRAGSFIAILGPEFCARRFAEAAEG